MSWLLNLAYVALLIGVSPILAWRVVVRGKYRTGLSEKLLGRVPIRLSNSPCLWFHAVSVGEVLQLAPVLAGLMQRLPGVEIVISTTTPTGRSVAEKKFPQHRVCYFPLDFSWAVREAIRRIRPTAIVLVELELWPNFIFEARRAEVPLALINGRLSERSSRGYTRIRPLVARMLDCFDTLAVQNRTYADRLIRLGAPKSRIAVTGSIKFDGVITDAGNAKTEDLRHFFGIDRSEPVFIAGSTQDPEESYALDTYLALRPHHPKLRLILVPRHKERFDEVARLIESKGLPLVRRSRRTEVDTSVVTGTRRDTTDRSPILLLDTLGELAACWGIADFAFVGGSLTNRGGQNMIEPAGYGAAIVVGPNTQNFRDVIELLSSESAIRVVRDASGLTATIANFLANPEEARAQGRRAQRLVLTQQGATAKTIELLANLRPFAENHATAA